MLQGSCCEMHFAFAHQCRVLVRGCSLGLVELYGDVTAEIQKLHLEECRGFVLWKAYFGICFENNSINIYNSDSKSYGHLWPCFIRIKITAAEVGPVVL